MVNGKSATNKLENKKNLHCHSFQNKVTQTSRQINESLWSTIDSLQTDNSQLLSTLHETLKLSVPSHCVEIMDKYKSSSKTNVSQNCWHSQMNKCRILNNTGLLDGNQKFDDSSLVLKILKNNTLLRKRLKESEENLCKWKSKVYESSESKKRMDFNLKEKKLLEQELNFVQIKLANAEVNLLNQKSQMDILQSKITSMHFEMERLNTLCADQEKLKLDNLFLERNQRELNQLRDENEKLMKHIKSLDELKNERNNLKQTYQNLKAIESECDMLRLQVEKVVQLEYDNNMLEKKVKEQKNCISEQEKEIQRLVSHIECLVETHNHKRSRNEFH